MNFNAKSGFRHGAYPGSRWARPAVVAAAAAGLLAPIAGEAFATNRGGVSAVSRTGLQGPPASCTTTGAPTCVYRVDTRAPEEIFEEGFAVPGSGTNNNLLDHVRGRSTLQAKGTTNFISTSTSLEYVRNYAGRLTPGGNDGWIYVIQPDLNFYDVRASLERATNSSSKAVRSAAKDALKFYKEQSEWAARGSIRPQLVQAAVPVKLVNGWPEPDWSRVAFNPSYQPGDATSGNTALYEITRATELPPCPTANSSGRTKRSVDLCDPGTDDPRTSTEDEDGKGADENVKTQTAVRDHDEIARTHRERLRAHGKDVEYVTSVEEFEKNSKSLLSPLRETNKLLNDAAAAKLGAEDFGEFSAQVGEAFSRDLRTVDQLATDAGLLAKVGHQAGRVGEFGVKALPYVGIAATGYAIAEDEKAGDYANLAFDSVAEGLQVAMVAQPELAAVLEPALLAEQLAQLIYNEIAGWVARHEQLDHDNKQWDSAAKDLTSDRDELWQNHLMGHALQELFPRLNEKFNTALTSDVTTLKKWAKAKKTALAAIAEGARERAASAEEQERISTHERELKKKIDATVWAQQDTRTKAYEEQVLKITTGVFASALKPAKDNKEGKSAFDTFTDAFFDKSVKPYLDKLEDRISRGEAPRNGASWNQAQLTRYQERWKHKREAKLAEVRQALSREGRTTLTEDVLRETQRINFPAKEAFRDQVRDRDRLFQALTRD